MFYALAFRVQLPVNDLLTYRPAIVDLRSRTVSLSRWPLLTLTDQGQSLEPQPLFVARMGVMYPDDVITGSGRPLRHGVLRSTVVTDSVNMTRLCHSLYVKQGQFCYIWVYLVVI